MLKKIRSKVRKNSFMNINSKNKSTSSSHSKRSNEFDTFFAEYHQRRAISRSYHDDSSQACKLKRAVFLSIVGLHESWKSTPLCVLFNAICVLPIKLDWLVNSTNHNNNNHNNTTVTTRYNSSDKAYNKAVIAILADLEFVNFLRVKWKQNLLFCTEDFREKSSYSGKYQQFWVDLSNALSKIYDPINPDRNYSPLSLNRNYWKYISPVTAMNDENGEFIDESFFNDDRQIGNVNFDTVWDEITQLTLHLRAMKQILEESNPSLDVFVFGYVLDNVKAQPCSSIAPAVDIHVDLDSNWWISKDYWDD